MTVWIIVFAVLFVAAVVLSRRASGGTHAGGCHGGAHAWPPDDLTARERDTAPGGRRG